MTTNKSRGSNESAGTLRAIAEQIVQSDRAGPPVAACTVITSPPESESSPDPGAKMLVFADQAVLGSLGVNASTGLEDAVREVASAAIPQHTVATLAFRPDGEQLHGRRAIEAAEAAVEVLVEVIEPAATLLIVGAGHVGLAIAELGAFLGMSVSVLDDRDEFANQERFPFADHVICGDFDVELSRFPFTTNTYVVLVSRGHLVDELSLKHVIQRDNAYVGMIGSTRRTRAVLEHLGEEGVPRERLDRVFTPIGLDVEAETPEEIAVAVLAETAAHGERRGLQRNQ
jgi:xanthine dehydrogenase accessory factor